MNIFCKAKIFSYECELKSVAIISGILYQLVTNLSHLFINICGNRQQLFHSKLTYCLRMIKMDRGSAIHFYLPLGDMRHFHCVTESVPGGRGWMNKAEQAGGLFIWCSEIAVGGDFSETIFPSPIC